MSRCNRCAFVETADEPLAAHAIGSGHQLCILCTHSLTEHEPQVCERCLQNTQQTLSAIVTLYGELPTHLGHLHGWNPRGRGSSDGVVGGTVLVLLGPGANGGEPRKLSTREWAASERWWLKGSTGPLAQADLMRVERERTGREHAADNLPTDSQAVSAALGSWAMEWSEERGEPVEFGHTPGRVVMRSAGYLETRMRWAANNHPAFDAFVADLRELLASCEAATSRAIKPGRANAECFECGGALVEVLHEVTVTQQRPDGATVTGSGLVHDVQDGFRCRSCDAHYPPGRYNLAVGEHLRAHAKWVPVAKAAEWAGVSVDQVKKWAKRWPNPVQSCCALTGERLVWWPDVQQRAAEREAS